MSEPQISFSQLSDGSWGVKVADDLGGSATSMAGKTVTVRKRNGEHKEVTLGSRVTSWNAGRAAQYRIARKPLEARNGAQATADKDQLAKAVEKLEKLEREGRLNGFTQGLVDAYKRDGTLSAKRVECLVGKPKQVPA